MGAWSSLIFAFGAWDASLARMTEAEVRDLDDLRLSLKIVPKDDIAFAGRKALGRVEAQGQWDPVRVG
jgi:hypothetical protein